MKSTIGVLLAVLLALTACGTKEQQPEAKKDGTGDMVQFARCMRENGVDMPDPKQGDGGGVVIQAVPGDGGDSGPPDLEKMNAAHEACKKHLPNGGELKPPSPEDQDRFRKQAKCMRDKGHDWPDPKFDGGGGPEVRELPNIDDDKVEQDMKDCGFGEGMVPARPVG
ncbi:hypothetical protein [Nocardia sp. NRRL S-836]|uniref:hypothetical protein n=1 Tax=Nocardia sp. NRRL S-836 TaxID=1519492 RepID=UPI0006AED9C9|nr:hypothetical protein [Nocardia sp. NRRL S-836]